MNKYIAFIALAILALPLRAVAGENDQFIKVDGGFLFNSTLHASIGYEKELAYGNAYELLAEVGDRWEKDPVCGKVCRESFFNNYYWDGAAIYKKCIKRYKNSTLRLFGGSQFGAFRRSFFFGITAGLEYNYVLPNGIHLSIQQKNQVNFRRGDDFRNGILVGIKIPI